MSANRRILRRLVRSATTHDHMSTVCQCTRKQRPHKHALEGKRPISYHKSPDDKQKHNMNEILDLELDEQNRSYDQTSNSIMSKATTLVKLISTLLGKANYMAMQIERRCGCYRLVSSLWYIYIYIYSCRNLFHLVTFSCFCNLPKRTYCQLHSSHLSRCASPPLTLPSTLIDN